MAVCCPNGFATSRTTTTVSSATRCGLSQSLLSTLLGEILPIRVGQSRNVTVKNLTIDWLRPLFSQADVTGAGEDWITFSADPTRYPMRTDRGRGCLLNIEHHVVVVGNTETFRRLEMRVRFAPGSQQLAGRVCTYWAGSFGLGVAVSAATCRAGAVSSRRVPRMKSPTAMHMQLSATLNAGQ